MSRYPDQTQVRHVILRRLESGSAKSAEISAQPMTRSRPDVDRFDHSVLSCGTRW
jgi:hypothetical protein